MEKDLFLKILMLHELVVVVKVSPYNNIIWRIQKKN